MKNLKRILSLSLVAIFCLGLVTFASAKTYPTYTSFPDSSKVTYKEAMDVLVAIGVIDGKDGNLAPTDLVTREEAAKMIAYICLGKTQADALSKDSTSFTDVETGRWSAGYIAFGVSRNIINGVGGGKFEPTGNVTGYQFMKMLLAAIGYNANKEYTGDSWAYAVSKDAFTTHGFLGSKAASYDAPATREEAMLYAFNILVRAMQVSYSSGLGLYYSGPSPLVWLDKNGFNKEYTLGWTMYGLVEDTSDTDNFGRPIHFWTIGGYPVTQNYATEPTLTYTTSVSTGALYTALGKTFANAVPEIFIDGEDQHNDTAPEKVVIQSAGTAKVGGNGVLTYVYADEDGSEVSIYEINTYLALVTSSTATQANITVYGFDGSAPTTYKTTAAYAANSYVLVTIGKGEVQSMTPATSFTGVLGQYAKGSYTIDGKAYSLNATYGDLKGCDSADDAASFDFAGTYTFFVDSYGYLLGNKLYSAATVAQYIYVKGSTSTKGDGTFTSTSMKVSVEYMDGTTDILDVALTKVLGVSKFNDPTTDTLQPVATSDAPIAAGFYRYVIDDSGKITVKALGSKDYAVAGIDIKNDTKALYLDGSLSNYYVNSSTVLTTISKLGAVTTYTGYDNFKGKVLASVKVLIVADKNNLVSKIYVLDGTFAVTSATTYYYSAGSNYTNSTGTYSYLYSSNGEKVAYKVSGVTLEAGKLYTAVITGSSAVLTEVTVENGFVAQTSVKTIGTSYINVVANNAIYFIDESTKMIDAQFGAGGAAVTTVATNKDVVMIVKDNFVKALVIIGDTKD